MTDDAIIKGKSAVSVTCPRPWNDELTSVRSQVNERQMASSTLGKANEYGSLIDTAIYIFYLFIGSDKQQISTTLTHGDQQAISPVDHRLLSSAVA